MDVVGRAEPVAVRAAVWLLANHCRGVQIMVKPRLDDPLTAEQLRAVLDYIPATGMFWWRHRPEARKEWNTRYAGQPAGSQMPVGYIQIMVLSRFYLAHRLAFLWMTGAWPRSEEVDHIDGDHANNAWRNLREVTGSQNKMNLPLRRDNNSGVKGVWWDKRRHVWIADIEAGGRRHRLGHFYAFEDAKAARIEAANRLHGEFARHD